MSFYGWYAVTQHRLARKRATAAALLHHLRRRRAACFAGWRVAAAQQRDVTARCQGYRLVRALRAKEKGMLMLR